MPVLLVPDQFERWLSGAMGAAELKPAAENALTGWPVSPRLNRTGYGDDDPTMIAPL
jgi:putative SOS response-associated peptidase YedK